jgi:photosystem II stability/assembly factor-like uncharacterized protein
MKRYHIIVAAILCAALGLGNNVMLAQTPSTNGLVAYYPSNRNANDESSNGGNASVNINENSVAGWYPLNSGTTEGLIAVHFPNTQTGYAVGNNGTILKTTDAGRNWQKLNSPTSDPLWSVYFTDSNTGCAVGGVSHQRFIIFKTTNGGNTWELKSSGTGNTLTDVYFVNANIGYAVGGGVGGNIMILKTTDGGNTWNPKNFQTTAFSDLFLSEVYFIDATTGYAVGNEYQGGKSIILKTTNGGDNWTAEIRNEYALASVYFTDINTGYIVGQYGVILKTIDAGGHWNPQSSGTQEHLFSVYFTDANTGYAAGGSSYQNAIILKTTNGGINWDSSYSATGYQLADVFFADANTGYAVGSSGTILNKGNDTGLVAYYPFNGNANDASGNGYHGTNNGATLTPDRFGNPNSAYSFDGVNDYIAVNNFPVLDRTFTYAAWLKVLGTTQNHQSFGAHGEGGAVGETWNFGYNTFHKVWDTYDRQNGTWQVNMNIGAVWTHVAIVYDNNVEHLYVNGVLKNSRNITTPVPAGLSNTLRIGTLVPGDQQFQGMIDEVRIYNRALADAEIQALFLSEPSLISPSNGATGISPTPALKWNAVIGATSYKLQVSSDSTLSTLVVNQSGLTSTSYNGGRLINNTTYFWRVKAVSASGESAWSSVRRFTTKPAPIYASVNNPQMAGTEFWVYVRIGDKPDSVANLFGLSFVLNFTPTDYIDVVTPTSSNVLAGPFMGTNLVLQQKVDEVAGKVSVGLSRKSGDGGVNGRGIVARIKFVASGNTPHGTNVQFSITEVTAIDASGASLPLSSRAGTLTINHANVTVWPGDTNNDGAVNQADVLPVGLYWGKTRPALPNASINWAGQIGQTWTPLATTYADANGDSVVNQTDVLPIGFNWGKTHAASPTLAAAPEMEKVGSIEGAEIEPKVNPSTTLDQEIMVQVHAANNLFGVAFELVCDKPEMLCILSVTPENAFGVEALFHADVNTAAGKAAVGISRKAGQDGISGDIAVVRVKAKISSQAAKGTVVNLSLQNVVANGANGDPIILSLRSAQINIGENTGVNSNEGTPLPTAFRLHQNHPNPLRAFGSNTGTLIRYELPTAAQVVVKVYNATGQEVRTLVNTFQQPGYYQTSWNGDDEHGQSLPSGPYLYRLQAGSFVQSYKMLLIR